MINFKDIMNGSKKTTRRQPSKGIKLSSYKPKKRNDIDRVLGRSPPKFSMGNIFGNQKKAEINQDHIEREDDGLQQVRGLIKNKKNNIIVINNHYGEDRKPMGNSQEPRKIKKIMTAFDGNSNLDAVYDSDLDGIPDHLDKNPHSPDIRMPLTRQGKRDSRSNKALSSIMDDV